jgi:hypothetical protein
LTVTKLGLQEVKEYTGEEKKYTGMENFNGAGSILTKCAGA